MSCNERCGTPHGAQAHCAICHTTFTGAGLFARHQNVDYSRKPMILCRSPQSLGLIKDAGGAWGTPEGVAKALRSTTTLATARSERRQK
jgi:hypothetical protein